MATRGPKTSKALFRDCLRLIAHMAGTSSPKALHLRTILKSQFLANAHITDPAKLHSLKQGCVEKEAWTPHPPSLLPYSWDQSSHISLILYLFLFCNL